VKTANDVLSTQHLDLTKAYFAFKSHTFLWYTTRYNFCLHP